MRHGWPWKCLRSANEGRGTEASLPPDANRLGPPAAMCHRPTAGTGRRHSLPKLPPGICRTTPSSIQVCVRAVVIWSARRLGEAASSTGVCERRRICPFRNIRPCQCGSVVATSHKLLRTLRTYRLARLPTTSGMGSAQSRKGERRPHVRSNHLVWCIQPRKG